MVKKEQMEKGWLLGIQMYSSSKQMQNSNPELLIPVIRSVYWSLRGSQVPLKKPKPLDCQGPFLSSQVRLRIIVNDDESDVVAVDMSVGRI